MGWLNPQRWASTSLMVKDKLKMFILFILTRLVSFIINLIAHSVNVFIIVQFLIKTVGTSVKTLIHVYSYL